MPGVLRQTMIFGERGYPAAFPENTLAGFNYALEQRVEGIEFDVQLTQDQVPVVFHDERLERVSNGTGYLRQYTLAELRRLRLARGEVIPTLAEVLDLVGQADVQLNLDFKTERIRYPGIEQAVFKVLTDFSLRRPMIFSSLRVASLRACQVLAPEASTCWLADQPITHAVAFQLTEHLASLNLRQYQEKPNLTEQFWQVDDPKLACDLFEQRVAGIFTQDFKHMTRLRDQVMLISAAASDRG